MATSTAVALALHAPEGAAASSEQRSADPSHPSISEMCLYITETFKLGTCANQQVINHPLV